MKRFVLPIMLVSVLTLNMTSCQQEKNEKPVLAKLVKSMVVQGEKEFNERRFPGKVYATYEATLSFKVPGKIIKLPILEGMEMKKGQLVSQLDPHDYNDKVRETEARYINLEAQYLRAKALVGGGHISRSDYDHKRSAYLVAKANFSTAQENLRETTIYAPFAGSVANKYVENHEYIKAKQKIIKLQDLSSLDIEISVPENIVINLNQGKGQDQVYAVFPAAPDKQYLVNYKEISTQADPETQTYQVKLKMPAPKGITVLPGMTATIIAKMRDYKSGGQAYFLIPSSAVFMNEDNQPSIWIIDNQSYTIRRAKVQVTRLSSGNIQVSKGLNKGDRIVIAGVHFLHEGEKVRIAQPSKSHDK